MATIPGIGLYTALTVVAMVGDVERFPDSDHLVSYTGRAPRVHQPATTLRAKGKKGAGMGSLVRARQSSVSYAQLF